MTPDEIAALKARVAALQKAGLGEMARRNKIEMRPAEDVAAPDADFAHEFGEGPWFLRGTDICILENASTGRFLVKRGIELQCSAKSLDTAKNYARSLAKEIRDAGGVP